MSSKIVDVDYVDVAEQALLIEEDGTDYKMEVQRLSDTETLLVVRNHAGVKAIILSGPDVKALIDYLQPVVS